MVKANVCLADGTNNNAAFVYTEIQLALLQYNNMLYALQLAGADLLWKKDEICFRNGV